MRFLVLLFLLIALVATAGVWQERWTRAARLERDAARGRIPVAQAAPAPTRLVLGRPSGQPPFDIPWGPPDAPPEGPSADLWQPRWAPGSATHGEVTGGEDYAAPPWEPVYEVEIRPGMVLSVLCQEFYGTSRPPVVQRVAEWNGLASPDHLRAGQRIELPARAWILAETP